MCFFFGHSVCIWGINYVRSNIIYCFAMVRAPKFGMKVACTITICKSYSVPSIRRLKDRDLRHQERDPQCEVRYIV